jgi:hypothetical protein
MCSLMAPGPRIRYGRKRYRASGTPVLHATPTSTRKPKSTAQSGCAVYAFSSQVSPARRSLARSPLPFLA